MNSITSRASCDAKNVQEIGTWLRVVVGTLGVGRQLLLSLLHIVSYYLLLLLLILLLLLLSWYMVLLVLDTRWYIIKKKRYPLISE